MRYAIEKNIICKIYTDVTDNNFCSTSCVGYRYGNRKDDSHKRYCTLFLKRNDEPCELKLIHSRFSSGQPAFKRCKKCIDGEK